MAIGGYDSVVITGRAGRTEAVEPGRSVVRLRRRHHYYAGVYLRDQRDARQIRAHTPHCCVDTCNRPEKYCYITDLNECRCHAFRVFQQHKCNSDVDAGNSRIGEGCSHATKPAIDAAGIRLDPRRNLTLIGTSTNLASAGLISQLGLEPYSLFEFVIPGLLLTVIGILYMSLLGHRLIPMREKNSLTEDYDVHDYLSELLIEDQSPAIGDSLASLHLDQIGITALAIVRDREKLAAHGNRKICGGDKIIVQGSRDALLLARDNRRFSIEAESTLTDRDVSSDELGISEVILMPRSRMIGKSLKELDFYARHGVAVLALYRRGHAYPSQIENAFLRVGDVLLIQGSIQRLERLARDPDLWVLKSRGERPLSTRKGVYAFTAMLGAILLGTTGMLPLSVAFLLGAVALVLTGCTTMEEAYASIEWRLLVLIACMGAFGVAMQDTGTASYLAGIIADVAAFLGHHATLAAFALLTVILTQPMSNAAAALVVLPVAVSTAELLGVDPRPFAIMVTLSASLSFVTPLEPASLLVFGIGKYRFRDFMRVGLPLTFMVIAVLVITIPILWPL